MDTRLSEEQKILKTMARDFLKEKCSKKLVKEMELDERGYSPELWQETAKLGWLGLIYPEKYGGSNMSFLDLSLIMEEMGRVCFPGPFIPTVVLAGLPILKIGNEKQKQKYLPEITSGKAIFTMAFLDPEGDKYVAKSIKTRATKDDNSYVINGTKMFVPYAHIADYILCLTRTKDSPENEEGITIFIVDARNSGLTTEVLQTVAGDKQCKVMFKDVKVPKENILGELHKGWFEIQNTIERASIFKCCEMLGYMKAVFEMTLEYVKTRVQFGVHIGSFQAVQWHCVDMAIDLESSQVITDEAIWRMSKGLSCSKEIAMAKAFVSDACQRIVHLGTQAHGGVALISDHDLPLYFRRAKSAELFFGDSRFHRKTVSRSIGFEVS